MMIRRCAWHLRYHGYPFWHGVASWRGLAVRFTDGICVRCLERFRDEHRSYLERKRVSEPELARMHVPSRPDYS
jgi:hypothetical protein